MKNSFLTSVIALALLSGCSNSDYEGQDIAGSKAIILGSVEEIQTRASGTSWAAGDEIGVSITDGNENSTNILYVTETGNGTFAPDSGTDIYILGNGDKTFTAYYPFTGTEGTAAGTVSFNVSDKQNAATQPGIDFLFATATANRTNPQVAFTFKHMMSRVDLTFTNASGSEITGNVTYTLSNILVDGTFNTATGLVTAGSTAGSIDLTSSMGGTSSIILPAQVTTGAELVIEVGGKYYTATFNLTTEASKKHAFNVTLNAASEGATITITGAGIEDWGTGTGGDIPTNPDQPEATPGVNADNWGENGSVKDITSN